jgi:hypothetical protein
MGFLQEKLEIPGVAWIPSAMAHPLNQRKIVNDMYVIPKNSFKRYFNFLEYPPQDIR